MENWKKVNKKKLKNYLTSVQLNSLARKPKGCLDDIILDIIAQVRTEVGSNPGVSLSLDSSLIPSELMVPTCHLIIEALQSRFPTLGLSDDQVRNANNARAFLKRIADGKVTLISIKGGQITHKLNITSKRSRLATQKTLIGL